MRDVPVAQHRQQLVVERPVHARDDVRKNDAIGPAGDRNAGERVGVPDELGARAVHGAQPRAAGQHERTVDIEEDELHEVLTFEVLP